MSTLTPEGRRLVHDLARRHGFGDEAVSRMLAAIVAGNGRMAQFDHPEFGGSGQWMSGGMLMLGDMFDHGLKGRVARLCTDLSDALSASDAPMSTDATSATRPPGTDRDHARGSAERTRDRGPNHPSRSETSRHSGQSLDPSRNETPRHSDQSRGPSRDETSRRSGESQGPSRDETPRHPSGGQDPDDRGRDGISGHQDRDEGSSHGRQGPGMAGRGVGDLPVNPYFTSSASSAWWPDELGRPTATGSQNALRYAYFADACRLAVERDGDLRVHDTLDHRIGGFSQQQGRTAGISLSSQHGTLDLDSLPIASEHAEKQRETSSDRQPGDTPHDASESARSGEDRAGPDAPARAADAGTSAGAATSSTIDRDSSTIDRDGHVGAPAASAPESDGPTVATKDDPLRTIERLGQLRDQGLLTDEEFMTKKRELLSRL